MNSISLNLIFDRLIEQLAEEVAAKIGTRQVIDTDRNELVDETAMAKLAKVSPQTLQRRRKANEIPFVRCGRRVLYRPDDVIATLASQKNGGDA